MKRRSLLVGWLCLEILGAAELAPEARAQAPKKVVFLPGTLDKGHPPGTHEYEKSLRLLKDCLDNSANAQGFQTEVLLGGWPQNTKTLDEADTLVVFANGADRRRDDHPFLAAERLQILDKHMARGCGLVVIHWALFVPVENGGEKFLDWIGGFFDYQRGPKAGTRSWYSKIQTATVKSLPASPRHPICRGLAPFDLREEYYYQMRFRPGDPHFTPILTAQMPGEKDPQTVAWAVQRAGGGRGFGFTGGHFFDNWKMEPFRRLLLNAIVWTARGEVPEQGVASTLPR